MAENDSIPQPNQDAIQLDDLTVLSRGQTQESPDDTEKVVEAPPNEDDSGYENIQSSDLSDYRKATEAEITGTAKLNSADIDRSGYSDGVDVPGIENGSLGQQIPVPLIDQPLPAAEVQFVNPVPATTPPPAPNQPNSLGGGVTKRK